jgi:hypothetical protein
LEIKKNDKALLDTINLDKKEAVFRYENLRSYGGVNGRHSRERELFVQKGLLSWMETWARYTTPHLGGSEKTDPQGVSIHKEHLAEGIHPQVIAIVAQMAMAVYRGAEEV